MHCNAATRNFITSGKSHARIGICPSKQQRVVLRRRNTVVGGKCALPSALLVSYLLSRRRTYARSFVRFFALCFSGCARVSWRCSTTCSWRRSSGCWSKASIFTRSSSVRSAHHDSNCGISSSSDGVYTPLVAQFRWFSSSFVQPSLRRLLMRYSPSVCPSVPCLCRLLNVMSHHCADVPFNWRRPAAATAGSQQQGGPLSSQRSVRPTHLHNC